MFAATVVQAAPAATPPDKPAPVIYIVAEVKSIQGVISYEALPFKSLADRQKSCHEQYVTALDEWKKAKADAAKKKEKFEQEKPIQPYVKRVLGSQTFKTEELAREQADKLQQKMEEAKKKAEENKKETAKPATDTTGDAKPEGGAAGG